MATMHALHFPFHRSPGRIVGLGASVLLPFSAVLFSEWW